MKFEKKSLKFLEKYLNTSSPTGYEHKGQEIWMDYIRPYVDKIEVDHYGTCYGIINPEAEFKVVIEAHADEISWYVNYITDDGSEMEVQIKRSLLRRLFTFTEKMVL
jgi:putative aminopeptidase FrvX